jgi:hypothetical protein
MDKKAVEFLDTHYTRLKPNHNFKRTARKPVLYLFYILYPKSQNGMGKITVYQDYGAKIEFMRRNETVSKPILFIHYIQNAIITFEEDKQYVSPIWYRRISILGNSALTKKLGGHKSRKVKAT